MNADAREVEDAGGFGIYVHWPYCAAICPYCDFNVYRDRGADHSALVDAICADIHGWARRVERLGERPRAQTVFFGGGTPSRLPAADVERILAAADAAFGLAANAEISLEANPEDLTPATMGAFRQAGVTRLSLGVQALEDAALKALGRFHTAADARTAVESAIAVFPEVSLDLIYARERQTREAWLAELDQACGLGATHLSLYQLTIEPGTAFEKRVERGALIPPSDEAAADLFQATREACAAAGYPAYEVSNHARAESGETPNAVTLAGSSSPTEGPSPMAARAHQSQHNLLYWRSGAWVGVGPGAHGRRGMLGGSRFATEAARKPADYQKAVAETGWGVVSETPIAPSAQWDEAWLMGLRLSEGVSLNRMGSAFGRSLAASTLAPLCEAGVLTLETQGAGATGAESDDKRVRVVPHAVALTDRIALEVLQAFEASENGPSTLPAALKAQ